MRRIWRSRYQSIKVLLHLDTARASGFSPQPAFPPFTVSRNASSSRCSQACSQAAAFAAFSRRVFRASLQNRVIVLNCQIRAEQWYRKHYTHDFCNCAFTLVYLYWLLLRLDLPRSALPDIRTASDPGYTIETQYNSDDKRGGNAHPHVELIQLNCGIVASEVLFQIDPIHVARAPSIELDRVHGCHARRSSLVE